MKMSQKDNLPKFKKKTKEEIWRESLATGQKAIIEDVLRIIRNDGNITILPDLIELYAQYKGSDLGNKIFSVISDIKKSEAVSIFMQYIDNKDFSAIAPDLLSIGWQSRLDFTPYFERLIELFISSDNDAKAIEIMTVIENFERDISAERIEREIQKLKNNIDKLSDFRKTLLVELVHILEDKLSRKEEDY